MTQGLKYLIQGDDIMQQDDFLVLCYHGSRQIVEHPDLLYSRNDIDFGVGFYMTSDETMAKKWACNKHSSYLNVYQLDISNLNIYNFDADQEWLEYCVANRFQEKPDFDESKYESSFTASAALTISSFSKL